MKEEEPLNVRVARALGCKPRRHRKLTGEFWTCTCSFPEHANVGGGGILLPYGENSYDGNALVVDMMLRGGVIGLLDERDLAGVAGRRQLWRAYSLTHVMWGEHPAKAVALCVVATNGGSDGRA